MLYAWLSALACAVLVLAEYRPWPSVAGVAKFIASCGFIAFALQLGALDSNYGRIILIGLALSMVGDMCLLANGQGRGFVAGLASFLLAHVAYVAAFVGLGLSLQLVAIVLLPVIVLLLLMYRYLSPNVHAPMRLPVASYVLVISLMLLAAGGTGDAWIIGGAVIFALSDIYVARERFVVSAWINRGIGLPLYYAAQLILAYTVAA